METKTPRSAVEAAIRAARSTSQNLHARQRPRAARLERQSTLTLNGARDGDDLQQRLRTFE